MFAIIGHDLKNPVAAISNFLEVLSTYYDEMNEDEKKLAIKLAFQSSKRLKYLVLDLLEWGKISKDMISVEKSPFNIGDIFRDVIDLQLPAAANKNIQLDYQKVNAVIDNDRNIINTVIRNFVSNSIKFTPRNGNIELSYSENDEYFLISIKDNGIGIKPEKQNDLFRIDKVTTTAGTENEMGTCLGLPISSELIKKCDGSILINSQIGMDSEFIIQLKKNL